MSDFTTNISIGQPSVLYHKYVIAFTVRLQWAIASDKITPDAIYHDR